MRFLAIDVETVAIPDVDTYLEPVSAPSNYKDAAKIAAYQQEARAGLIDKAALDIDLARIVCLGWQGDTYAEPQIRLLEHADEEAGALLSFWANWEIMQRPILVTFNGLAYDVPLLLRRSLYLNIEAPRIQTDRFKHPDIIDLLALLSLDGRLKYHSQSFYANRFGLPQEPDIQGKDIGAAVAAKDWTAVEKHCRCDVQTTMALARRMRLVPTTHAEVQPALPYRTIQTLGDRSEDVPTT